MAAIQSINRSNEADRSMIPDDLITKENYVVACIAFFEDSKTRMLEALLKCVRLSLLTIRKRYQAWYLFLFLLFDYFNMSFLLL